MVNPPTVIVLAAGEGSRIGMPKAMLEINGRCFLERIIDTLIIAGIEEIIVVLGAEAENIKSMTDLSIVNVVINENFHDGQFSSLQCGLDELEFPGDVLVFPVDHPLVMPKTVSTIVDSISNGDYQTASVPVHEGAKGHPVFLKRILVEEVMKAQSEFTLRDILWKNPADVKQIAVDDPGVLSNIDTPEDYEKHIRHFKK